MAILELTDDSVVQQCERCGRQTRSQLDELVAGVDSHAVRMPECSMCKSVEFLLPTANDEPEHRAPGSFGHRHQLLVDHLHATLVERGNVDGAVADLPKRGMSPEALERWFPRGLKLEVTS